uniref:Uncharacterized protein n=2 Tax=Oryza glumipatula TaxID=40148 RepID=A0A0D9Z9A2_9ORYZ
MSQSSFPSPFRSSDAAVDLRAPVALTCNTRPCCCCRCHCRRLCSLVASSSPDVTRNTRRHWQHSCRGRQPAAGTARFLETLIERADCRCGTSTLCSTTTLQSTDQECPFVEKLCSKSNSHLNAINYQAIGFFMFIALTVTGAVAAVQALSNVPVESELAAAACHQVARWPER